VTTTATGSPTNRTTSRASSHWPISAFIIPGIGGPTTGRSARSAQVKAAMTPGACSAALKSTERILA